MSANPVRPENVTMLSPSDSLEGRLPKVSVIICTRDRPDDLARAVGSVRACGPAGHEAEIVVVEEAASPRPISGVRYVHLAPKDLGFGYARNIAVREAGGEILAFIDDDCVAETGWLESLTAPLEGNPKVLGVAGAVMVRDCGRIGYAENILGFPGGGLRYRHAARGRLVPTRYLSTCNCAYRREAVLRAGGFPEDARLGGEDFLLAERVTAMGPCVYAPAAVVYHRPRGRLGAIFRWFARRGESEITLLAATRARGDFLRFLIRSSWSWRGLVLLGALMIWPDLVFLVPPTAVLYYGVVLWRFRFARAYPTHRSGWWLVPIVKLTMDLGTELGRWKTLLRSIGP
jgi:GT2 family glycosyltransferase